MTAPTPGVEGLSVAYLLAVYPRLSETFVGSEVDAAQRAGVRIEVFAGAAESGHAEAGDATAAAPIHYAPPLPTPAALVQGLHHVWWVATRATGVREALLAWWLGCRLSAQVREYAPDVIHAHFATLPTLTAALLGRWFGVPVTATFHANDYLVGVRPRALARRSAGLSAVFAISDSARVEIARLTGLPRERIGLVRASVARNVVERAPARDIESGRVVVVARLVPKKGHRHLIAGLAELRRTHDVGATLTIVGDGPLRSELEQQCRDLGMSDAVTFTGALAHQDAMDIVWTAHVAALTAVVDPDGDADGIPVFLMEAAAAARPVIATAVGGVGELVDHDRTGLVLDEIDPESVAAALRRALGPDGQRFGAAARHHLRAEFDPERQVQRLAGTWLRCTSRRGTVTSTAQPSGTECSR